MITGELPFRANIPSAAARVAEIGEWIGGPPLTLLLYENITVISVSS
jgi:hypothetical protein